MLTGTELALSKRPPKSMEKSKIRVATKFPKLIDFTADEMRKHTEVLQNAVSTSSVAYQRK